MDSRSTVKGIGVSGSAHIVASAISITVYLWLVSQLSPEEMGVVALGYSFYLLMFLFKDFGLTPLVITRRSLTPQILSAVFSLRLIVMAVLVIFALLGAFFLPSLFNAEGLTWILVLIAIALVSESVGFIPGSLLQRELEFRKLAKIDVLSSITAGIVTITSALLGFPLLALFVGMAVGAVVRSISLLSIKRLMPRITSKGLLDRELLAFGGKLFANRMVIYLVMNLNVFVLAGQDLALLGLYGLALQWVSKPADIAVIVINRVLLPTYSALERIGGKMLEGFRKSARILSVCVFTAFVVVFSISPVLMQFLYGSEWDLVIPLIHILLVYSLCRVLAENLVVLLISLERPGTCLAVNLVNLLVVGLLSFPLAREYGAIGCALLLSSVYTLHLVILLLLVFDELSGKVSEFISEIRVPAAISIASVSTGILADRFAGGGFGEIALLCSTLVTFCTLTALFARKEISECLQYVRATFHIY